MTSATPGSSLESNGSEVLIIKPGALGDTLLGLTLVGSIKRLRPNSLITFCGNRAYSEIVDPPTRFTPFDSIENLWLNSDVSRQPVAYEAAYVVLNRPDYYIQSLEAVGVEEIISARALPEPGRHIVVSMHEALGLPVPAPRPLFGALSCGGSSRSLWLHPGSGGPQKCIPMDDMAEIALDLAVRLSLRITMTCTEQDAFLKETKAWNRILGFPGTRVLEDRSLSEIRSKLKDAALFLGNDSGMAHLAGAMGIRGVVFFVCTDHSVWSPWVSPGQLVIADVSRGPLPSGEDLLNAWTRLGAYIKQAMNKIVYDV